ncbi:P1 family peptidase [Egibacter rhizosphaerae]|uniref:P1 family peptidase n=1 Tax=Egibacter rhizosphaerae TaxID=1670831 RepID=UPI00197AF1E3|nr:P1 family peptidase [Egibacter rhizosphaerae]
MALGVEGVAVGHWTDERWRTGCTVVLPPPGTMGGASVRGGAPGTREVPALGASGSGLECHGILLTGGSAFGLAAADGVMRWLAERRRGVPVGPRVVPVVGGANLLDLRTADQPTPGPEAGHAACEVASTEEPTTGSVGVGAGCMVGKTAGVEHAVAGGVGLGIASHGDLTAGALVAANAVGDVVGPGGEVLAGDRAPVEAERYPFGGPLLGALGGEEGRAHTVIGCVATNARLDKSGAVRAAELSHGGLVRAVRPAHTQLDGDCLFLLATGQREAPVDAVAALAAEAVATAVRMGVRDATDLPGAPADPRAKLFDEV